MGKEAGQDKFQKRSQDEQNYKKLLPGEDDAPLPAPVEPIKGEQTPGRNDDCPCGSGKKFKKCCGKGTA